MEEKMLVSKTWLGAVASLIESCATLCKEGLDFSGRPPEETLIELSKTVKQVIGEGGKTMDNTFWMSHEILDEVLTMPNGIRAKYREALRLITDEGVEPEKAFQQSGFVEEYEKFKGSDT